MQNLAYRISEKNRAVIIHHDPRVTQTIPHAEHKEKDGKVYTIVPHRHTESRLLRNFGYDVPAPIFTQYNWAGSVPFESQKYTAALLTENRRAYVLNEIGTGKTRASLFAADFLMRVGDATKVLVVAPLSTLNTVWRNEIFSTFMDRDAVTLHGPRKRRLELLKEDVNFYIINHDGVKVIEDALHSRPDIDIIIVDELASFRNKRTERWKCLNRISKQKKFVWGLTGSPIPKAPTDAFGQVKLITPERGPMHFKAFQQETMTQVSQFKWYPRKNALETVYKIMQPSVRYTRAECVDLPPTTYSTREVDFTVEQKKAFNEMYAKMLLAVHAKDFSGNIMAANSGVQLSKLLQIGAGFIYGFDSNRKHIAAQFNAKPRESLLQEIIDEASAKVIVFAPFTHTVLHLSELLDEAGYSVATIHGQVVASERDRTFNLFQNARSPRVLVAHPGTMAHGLTLTAANTIVWYSPVFNLETFEQANGRITRPGQNLHTHIVCIEGSPMEKRVYKALRQRSDMQAALLRMFNNQE